MKYLQTLTTYRLGTVSGDNDIPVLNLTVEWNIQSWSEGRFSSVQEWNNIYKMFMIYIDWNVDIVVNDIIIDADWREYYVRGVEQFSTDFTDNTQIEAISVYTPNLFWN